MPTEKAGGEFVLRSVLDRRAQVRATAEAGFSLMEVLVAIFIVTIVMTSSAAFFINGLKSTGGASQRQTAIVLADQAIDAAQAVPAANLLSGRTQASVTALLATTAAATYTAQDQTSSGNYDTTATASSNQAIPTTLTKTVNAVVYTIRTFIDPCYLAPGAAPGACGPTNVASDTPLMRVTVDVSWTPTGSEHCTGGCNYSASTLINQKTDASFNSNISTPTVTAISPTAVAVGTTQTLVISGTGFVAGAIVSITSPGGTTTTATANTGSSITTSLTAGTVPGNYMVYVVNPDGGRAGYAFTEDPLPIVTGETPTSVVAGTTNTLTITGTTFNPGLTVTTDSGVEPTNVVITSTKITCTYAPDGTADGSRTFTITNTDGGVTTFPVTVTQSTPTITAMTPATIVDGVSTTVIVTGTSFLSGITATATGATITSSSLTSSTSGTVTLVGNGTALGNKAATLTVTNTDGGTASYSFTTTQSVPTYTSGLSTLYQAGQTYTATLNGSDFMTGASLLSIGATISSYTFLSANQVTVTFVPTGTIETIGGSSFTISNPDGGKATITFTTIKSTPTLTGITPTTITHGQSVTFTLTGTDFVAGATVKITNLGTGSGTYTLNVTSATSGTFTLTAPTTTGTYATFSIVETNPDGGTASGATSIKVS